MRVPRESRHGSARAALKVLALVATFFSLAASLEASILVNGSFEDPLVPTGYYTNFSGGSTAITGWTVVGVDAAVVSTTFAQNGIHFQAQDGDQWIDLAGVVSNSQTSGVSQVISTVIGVDYLVSFFVGSAADTTFRPQFFFPATIDLSIDGGPRVSFTNPNSPNSMLDWMQFDYQFTATTTATNITFYNGGAANNYNSALDNVTVNRVDGAVPEAASALIWGVLTLGVGAVARFRRVS